MNHKVREILVNVARKRSLITYGELVHELGLPSMDGAWAAHPLASIFETLDQEDANAKRPFHTTVVVKSKSKNRDQTPGSGYYEALERLKGIQARNSLRRLEVFTHELQALYALHS
jgi:hypothetical protein